MKSVPKCCRRSGLGSIWGLAVLSTLAVLSVSVTSQLASNRKANELRDDRIRAEWLARSGVELAIDKLLDDYDGWTGETPDIIPESEVKIVVQKKGSDRRIEVEAVYPKEGKIRAKLKVARDVQRVESNGRVRIKVTAAPNVE